FLLRAFVNFASLHFFTKALHKKSRGYMGVRANRYSFDTNGSGTHNMKFLGILFVTTLSLPLTAIACPIGMQFNGNGCSPPYFYSGWDLMRDRRAAIEAIGSGRPPAPGLTAEEARKLDEDMKQLEKEKAAKREVLAKGIWDVDSKSTPEGNLCAAVFSKYTLDEGGTVTIMGFQSPKPDAWLIFQGVGLPMSKAVTKMKITLQHDDEP